MSKQRLIRVMIVDDEEPARNELKYLLQQYPDLAIVCEAANFQEAVDGMKNHQPHLVFLDIQMPGINGINVAENLLENFEPLVVFATAHEEYALKAFELNAADYLLKPFSPKRIAKCIEKIRSMMAAKAPVEIAAYIPESATPACCKQKLAIEQNGKAQIIDIQDIIAAASSEGQIVIYTRQKNYQVNMTLQDLQARLDENMFFRCHRSFLVNIEKIREVIPWFNGTYNLVVEGLTNAEIPVSRQQAPRLKKMFSL
jgi:two-component system LytT family response regulator/two-component system response regulator LytT